MEMLDLVHALHRIFPQFDVELFFKRDTEAIFVIRKTMEPAFE